MISQKKKFKLSDMPDLGDIGMRVMLGIALAMMLGLVGTALFHLGLLVFHNFLDVIMVIGLALGAATICYYLGKFAEKLLDM